MIKITRKSKKLYVKTNKKISFDDFANALEDRDLYITVSYDDGMTYILDSYNGLVYHANDYGIDYVRELLEEGSSVFPYFSTTKALKKAGYSMVENY